jgi:hypothetical protein
MPTQKIAAESMFKLPTDFWKNLLKSFVIVFVQQLVEHQQQKVDQQLPSSQSTEEATQFMLGSE